MALKIKFTRTGKKGKTSYRIIVAEERSKRDGKAIDHIGYYDPSVRPEFLKYDKEKLDKWIKNGAKPTESVKKTIKI